MRDIYLRAKGRTVIWRGDMLDLIYHNTAESLLRRSCADQLRRAHSARRVSPLSDATRRMMRPEFISPRVDLNFKGRGPQS